MHTHHFTFNNYIIIGSIILIGLYFIGVFRANKEYKKWPMIRIFNWIIGVLSIMIALLVPMQHHDDFMMHMYAHLLIGMISPLALALSHPLTLLLRNLSVKKGRQLTPILKSAYFRVITHPMVAMIINIGGLWFIYYSGLIHVMHEVFIVNVIIHIHIFLGGYFFVIAVLSIQPLPHRVSFKLRTITLIIFMALHSILAKWLYANPPIEDAASVRKGAMLMYYGGDIVDVVIVVLLLYEYYKPTKKTATSTKQTIKEISQARQF